MEAFEELCQVLESGRKKNHRSGITESLNSFILDKIKLNKVTYNLQEKKSHPYYCFCSEYDFSLPE